MFEVFWCFCFLLFRATPVAYGSSQARGRIRVQLPYVAATAMWDLSLVCNRHHSSWQWHILNPLRGVRDRTLVLMVTSQVHYC